MIKDAKKLRNQPLVKKEQEYKRYIKKCNDEDAALKQLKKKHEKLIQYVENDTVGAKFACPISILLLLAVFCYASLFLLPAAAYNIGIELPTVVEALISEYVLGVSVLVAIVLIVTGVTRHIWLAITGKKFRYNAALKEINTLTKQLDVSREYCDFYEKEIKHAKFPKTEPVRPNAHINMTFHNMAGKITNTYMDTEDSQENDEEEELLRIRYEEEREREEQERIAAEKERKREEEERERQESDEYIDMLEEQAIFFDDDSDYGY